MRFWKRSASMKPDLSGGWWRARGLLCLQSLCLTWRCAGCSHTWHSSASVLLAGTRDFAVTCWEGRRWGGGKCRGTVVGARGCSVGSVSQVLLCASNQSSSIVECWSLRKEGLPVNNIFQQISPVGEFLLFKIGARSQ